jgi:hypothetical protein
MYHQYLPFIDIEKMELMLLFENNLFIENYFLIKFLRVILRKKSIKISWILLYFLLKKTKNIKGNKIKKHSW